ncbi:MAG: DUF1616 domain-containing protein [Methanomicrobiales archaeon]|nr:DUF1616 domain-containing protein [Methanomicrobiales archaeon]
MAERKSASPFASPDLFHIPIDLAAIAAWIVITAVFVQVPPLQENPARVVFALPMVLFVPGYALIAALFPANRDLDLIERIALSFGLSIAVVPLTGLMLNYTPWGIRLVPVLFSLLLFTVAMIVIAHLRRLMLPREERFSLPLAEMLQAAKGSLFPAGSGRLDLALSMLLVASIIAAIATTAYVIAVPKEGEKFTEFYILGVRGKAADYPGEVIIGREYPLIIGIGNHEYRNVTYTVEIHLMNVTFDVNESTPALHASELLDSFRVTVAHNTTEEKRWNLSVQRTGYNRVEFLLFNESLPDEGRRGMDRIDAAYRDLHLWVEIRSSNG